MYKIFYGIITLIWIGDICNLPPLEFLDTTLPCNTLFWLLVMIFLPFPATEDKIE